ncbi:MAG TPA: hypothetical protein VG820_05730 [Fimbriimonadaceae bacterium]|nr:hypothetical protein [Fimbriimonadaceae bacterium]
MVACALLATSAIGSAQGYGHGQDRNRDRDYAQRNLRDLRDLVNQTERHSNSFRSYFEHNFRSNGHPERWTGGSHREHEGPRGQMTLRDAIQNLDEDFERLRTEVDHHGKTREARRLMDEIVDHSGDVDSRIGRVRDWYDYNRDRNWRYERSDLASRWRDLRSDINNLARNFNARTRW